MCPSNVGDSVGGSETVHTVGIRDFSPFKMGSNVLVGVESRGAIVGANAFVGIRVRNVNKVGSIVGSMNVDGFVGMRVMSRFEVGSSVMVGNFEGDLVIKPFKGV